MPAARSVGSIEVTVNADTGRLTAQLVKGGRTAGQAGADAISRELGSLDTKKLQAQLKLIKKKVEAELSQMEADVGIDTSEFQADLKRLQARVRAAQLELQIGTAINDPDLEADLAKLRTRIELMRADVQAGAKLDRGAITELEARLKAAFAAIDVAVQAKVDIDEAAFASAVAEMEARVGDITAMIEPELDKPALGVIEAQLETALADIDALVEVGVQPGQVKALREYVELRLQGIKADIEADVDEKSVASALARLNMLFSGGGEEAGGLFGDGAGRGLSTRSKLIAGSVAVLLEPAFVAVQDLAAAFTAVLGSAFNGLVAGAGAAAPVIAGLGAVLTGAVVGSLGFGGALGAVNEEMAAAVAEGREFNGFAEGINDALKGLSPNAQAAARAFGGVRTELADVQAAVQDRLFEDFDDVITSLATRALPSMEQALKGAATEANIFGQDLADLANNTDFAGLFNDLQPAIRPALQAVRDLIGTIEPFLSAAAPAAERVAEAFARGAAGLREMTEQNPEGIADFLDRGLDSLVAWGDLLVNIGDALGTIFAAGQTQGDGFVQTLADIVGRWDAWLESIEGQEALQEFFDGGAQTIAALAPVVDALGEAFNTIVTDDARGRFESLAQALADAIPVIAELVAQIGRLQIAEGFLTLFQAISPFVAIVAELPDGVLQVVGAMIALSSAAKVAAVAFSAFGKIPGPLLAITAALAVVKVAYDAFTGAQREIDEVTKTVTRSLQAEVEEIVNLGNASQASVGGITAMNEALTGTTEDGDKTRAALGTLGLTVEDTTSTLIALGRDPVAALQALGEGMGLSAEEALALAEAIDATDNSSGALINGLLALRDNTKLTKDEQEALILAMEELQDQAGKNDLDAIARGHLAWAASADESTQAILAQAEANKDIGRSAKDVLPLYEEFVRLQIEASAATNAATGAFEASTHPLDEIAGLQRVLATETAKATAERVAAGEAARAAAAAEDQLARDTDKAIRAIAEQVGFSESTAQALQGLGDGARAAAEQADSLRSALDLLLAPQLSAQEAADALEQNMADLAEQAWLSAGAVDAAGLSNDKWAASIDNTTQVGRDNREQIRENVAGILEYASSALEAGVANDEVAATVATATGALRDQLINGFGASEAAADEYIATLLGTPGLLETAITQPGMLEALVNGDDLVLTYDAAGNPVITNFSTPGLAGSVDAVGAYQTDLTGVDNTDPNSTFTANLPEISGKALLLQQYYNKIGTTNPESVFSQPGMEPALADSAELQELEDGIDDTNPSSTFTMPGLSTAIIDVSQLQTALNTVDRTSPSVTISLPGISSRISEVNNLKAAIDRLSSKSVTITTYERTLPGSMTGELITGPTVRQVGEYGYREAIIPLDLPLNRVDPSVRDLAAMLRGQGPARPAGTPPTASQPQVTHVHNWNISEVGDGEATAHRVMNRLIGSL